MSLWVCTWYVYPSLGMELSFAWECTPSPSARTFPLKDPFVFTGQPRAIHSAFGGQLCPGDCSCPFFLFWPRASGDRLNNHPGAPPESQDEEGQEALAGGREQAGGKAEEVQHHVVAPARAWLSASMRSSEGDFLRTRPLPPSRLFLCGGLG